MLDSATLCLFGVIGIAFVILASLKFRNSGPRFVLQGPPNLPSLPAGSYDVIIVGAGPSGSTMAYFLARSGKRVLLLERKKFPRIKLCGDAWCSQALDLLEEMEWAPGVSVLAEIQRQGLCRPVERGGFVSPFGHECINTDGCKLGAVSKVRTWAMKRVIADEFIARAAARAGADLREETEANVSGIAFASEHGGYWTVPIKDQTTCFTARVLVAADGATSYLARQLGLVSTEPDAVCSHRYVCGGTHELKVDGVMFFNRAVLPGYSALFRHYNDDVYLGTYILPGGAATSRCIAGFEEALIDSHPVMKTSFGKPYEEVAWNSNEAQGENGRMKTAGIRCGGESRSFGDHLIVIGDAAGQTDPMTGEGIHTSMIAAKLAAQTVDEMFANRDFSARSTAVYQTRWMDAFGNDFAWSAAGAKLIYNFPILLDATCAYGKARGQWFLDEFGLIMTGVKPKSAFLNPMLAIPIGFYLCREVVMQYVLRRKPLVPQDIGQALVDKSVKKRI